MTLLPTSILDAPQIIQQAYDEPNQRIRVDAQVSVVIGVVDVTISDLTDSIKIGDGTGNYLKINADGSITVTTASYTTQVTKITYNNIASVATNTLSTIVTYTVPGGKKAILQTATASGENIAKYDILRNGTPLQTRRTYFGGDLNTDFEFLDGFNLIAGDIIQIKVIHQRPMNANFEASIQVIEV